jgi:hypothetical protein
MGRVVSSHRLHGNRCQLKEASWVQLSVPSVHGYRCQSTECSCYTVVSPQRVHWYTEWSWVQMSVHRGFVGTGVSPMSGHGYRC